MSRRSWWLYPGGFVRTTFLTQRFRVEDPVCVRCRHVTCGPWWLHVETGLVVCDRCMGDSKGGPYLEDGGRGEFWRRACEASVYTREDE